MKRIQLCNLRRGLACWAVSVGVLLLCCVAGAAEPSSDGPKEKAKPDDQKIVYLKEVWKPLGPNHNIVLKDKTWHILDNSGKRLLAVPSRERDGYRYTRIGSSGGRIYFRGLNPDIKKRKQDLVLPIMDARSEDRFIIPAYNKIVIQETMGLAIAYGKDVYDLEPWFYVEAPVATSLKTKKRIQGELPLSRAASMEIVSCPDWKTFYLISGGDYRKKDNPLMLLEFDKNLKQTFSHVVSRRGQRLQFVCTDKDTIYIATTTPQLTWDFMYYDVKTRKLSDVPFRTPKGMRHPNALALGDGKLVVWGRDSVILYEPRMALRKRPKVIELPDPKGMAIAQQPGAVAKDGRFALAAHYRSARPKIVLVYSKEGKLLEQIEVKEGFIEHLKFVSGGKELLVFAREYTARVKLNPLPVAKPTTQPVRQGRPELSIAFKMRWRLGAPAFATEEFPVRKGYEAILYVGQMAPRGLLVLDPVRDQDKSSRSVVLRSDKIDITSHVRVAGAHYNKPGSDKTTYVPPDKLPPIRVIYEPELPRTIVAPGKMNCVLLFQIGEGKKKDEWAEGRWSVSVEFDSSGLDATVRRGGTGIVEVPARDPKKNGKRMVYRFSFLAKSVKTDGDKHNVSYYRYRELLSQEGAKARSQALVPLGKLIKAYPNEANLLYARTQLLVENRRYKEAIEDLSRIEALVDRGKLRTAFTPHPRRDRLNKKDIMSFLGGMKRLWKRWLATEPTTQPAKKSSPGPTVPSSRGVSQDRPRTTADVGGGQK
ncbi:MAG: hypothetical protein GY794_02535 [bacterium]|nr:hypothetical protein [bacterium]